MDTESDGSCIDGSDWLVTTGWRSDFARRATQHAALGDPHRLAMYDLLAVSDRAPSALAEAVDIPRNLAAHHLDVLEQAGLVERIRSQGDGRRRYVRRVAPLVEAFGAKPSGHAIAHPIRRVLFVCRANAARSQMAAALWRARTSLEAQSAGTEPAERVHPLAVEIAAKHGLSLSGQRPKHLREIEAPPDLVISVCDVAYESGVDIQVDRQLHWSVDDPVEHGTPAAFDAAWDEIASRIDDIERHLRASESNQPGPDNGAPAGENAT